MLPPRFSVRDIVQTKMANGYIIVVTTDVACNLYMRWTITKPLTHKDPILKRGRAFSEKTRFCFVDYDDNWQEEAGDTLIHTFIKLNWPSCQTRWFYFWGFIAGVLCASETALFEKHFYIPPMIGPFYQQIDASPWTLWTKRELSPETYLTCHNNPVATVINNSSSRRCHQSYNGVNNYRIDRKQIYFDTSVIPADAIIYGATLSQYITFTAPKQRTVHIFNAPLLHNPPILADYGYCLTLTTNPIAILLAAAMKTARDNVWKINSLGMLSINRTGLTKWCMRTIDDINAVPPVALAEGIYLSSDPEHLTVVYYLPV